jgi:hypothetical protein
MEIHSQPKGNMQNEEERKRKAGLLLAYKELAWRNQDKEDLAYAIINMDKTLLIQKNENARLIDELNKLKSKIEEYDRIISLM